VQNQQKVGRDADGVDAMVTDDDGDDDKINRSTVAAGE
jgi:hypothetical protein